MSTIVNSKDWCPTCLLQNKVQSVLQNRPGQFYSNCAAGHQFPDTEELNGLREQARRAYPMLYQTNAPAPADPNAFAGMDIVLNAEVKKSIEELTGQNVTSGSDLKGLIYAYFHDNKDKENEIRSIRATMATMGRRVQNGSASSNATLQPGQFVVSAPEWAMEGIAGQAKYQEKSPEEWIEEQFGDWCENYFGAKVQR